MLKEALEKLLKERGVDLPLMWAGVPHSPYDSNRKELDSHRNDGKTSFDGHAWDDESWDEDDDDHESWDDDDYEDDQRGCPSPDDLDFADITGDEFSSDHDRDWDDEDDHDWDKDSDSVWDEDEEEDDEDERHNTFSQFMKNRERGEEVDDFMRARDEWEEDQEEDLEDPEGQENQDTGDDLEAGQGEDEDDDFGDLADDTQDEDGDEMDDEDPDRQGLIRVVPGAHLVYKRTEEDGTFEELWIFNTGDDFKKELQVRRAILAGTDIPPNKMKSQDGTQSYALWNAGNAQMLHITGLPS